MADSVLEINKVCFSVSMFQCLQCEMMKNPRIVITMYSLFLHYMPLVTVQSTVLEPVKLSNLNFAAELEVSRADCMNQCLRNKLCLAWVLTSKINILKTFGLNL